MSLVGACWTETLTSEEERKRWQEKMAKAEELRNTAGIHTELLRPAYFQPGRPWGTERMDEGVWGMKEWKSDILIRKSRERADELQTQNSSCLLKSRTFFLFLDKLFLILFRSHFFNFLFLFLMMFSPVGLTLGFLRSVSSSFSTPLSSSSLQQADWSCVNSEHLNILLHEP